MKKFVMTVVGSLVLVGASAGITAAVTSSTSSSPATVHAYYNNKTHQLYFSTSAAHPSGTTAISWLQSGTAGPKGIDVAWQAKNNAAGENSVSLNCPADHPYLIAGGGGGGHPEFLVYNGPANMGKGWRVEVEDNADNYPAESVYVQIACAK